MRPTSSGHDKVGGLPGRYRAGGLVDEAALLYALETDHLTSAGLELSDHEPSARDHHPWSPDDVTDTPHIAGATAASKDRLWRPAIDQILQVLRGERPSQLVNRGCWPTREFDA